MRRNFVSHFTIGYHMTSEKYFKSSQSLKYRIIHRISKIILKMIKLSPSFRSKRCISESGACAYYCSLLRVKNRRCWFPIFLASRPLLTQKFFRTFPSCCEMMRRQTFLHISGASKVTHADRRSEVRVYFMLLKHKIGMEIIEQDKHILLLNVMKRKFKEF